MPESTISSPLVGTLRLPATIHFGYGARARVPGIVAGYGRRALVVVDPFLADSAEFTGLLNALGDAGVTTTVHSDILPELPVEHLVASARSISGSAPEVILAYGGGSALDAAKVIALLLTHEGPLDRFYGENAVPGPVLPLVAVPTTAGTGSEVTPVAVVSDSAMQMKVGISSSHLIPAAAVVDPELTLGAPPTVTAYAGIDALVHAVESYTAAALPLGWSATLPLFTGDNRLAAPMALEAAHRIATHLPTAVADGSDREARGQVALGSLLAGIAFGPTGTHLSHALQYPIGAITKTPHGLGTGLMLPYVLQACAHVVPERVAEIGRALGCAPGDTASVAADAVRRVEEICRAIGIPASLADLGIRADQLDHIAELALRSHRLITISPVAVDAPTLTGILRAAHAGDRSLIDPSTLSAR